MGPPSDAAVLARQASVWANVPLPQTSLAFSPATGAVTQLPTIISAAAQEAFDSEVLLQIPGFPAVPLTVHATPHWHFDFGDGTSLDSDVPGTPYDGTDPVDHPEHYVTATYHRTGEIPATVTVTWSATAVRHDTNQTLTLTGTAARTASVTIPVREAKSELTGGPDD